MIKKTYQADTQKQLIDDFCVAEYLRQNQLTHNNSELFSTLLNEIHAHKNKKTHKLQQLQEATLCASSRCNERRQESDDIAFAQIAKAIAHEQATGEELNKRMLDYQKSLMLMKGDIGHIINRNQAEKRLQSKIHKVRLLAADQLYKVNSQLKKDNEEHRELSLMQMGFSSKLKSVRKTEKSTIERTKQQYFQAVARQKLMNQKLLNIEQRSQQIKEKVELNKQKNYNVYVISYLSRLLQGIHEMMQISTQNHSPCASARSSLLIQRNQSRLDRVFQKIVQKSEEISSDLTKIHKQKIIFTAETSPEFLALNIIDGYKEMILNVEGVSTLYWDVLNKFRLFQQTLSQLQRHQEPKLEDESQKQQNQQAFQMKKRLTSNMTIVVNYLNFTSKDISSLTKDILRFLTHHEECQFFDNLLVKITEQSQIFVKSSKRFFVDLLKLPKNIEKQVEDKEEQMDIADEDIQPMQQNDEDSINLLTKYISATLKDENVAKRVQYLEETERGYLKMLKKTLKMEKQHTRKNYEFQRNFKRDKYVNRDAVLEEKRFQASFSHLWKNNITSSATRSLCAKKIFQDLGSTQSSLYATTNWNNFTDKIKTAIHSPCRRATARHTLRFSRGT